MALRKFPIGRARIMVSGLLLHHSSRIKNIIFQEKRDELTKFGKGTS